MGNWISGIKHHESYSATTREEDREVAVTSSSQPAMQAGVPTPGQNRGMRMPPEILRLIYENMVDQNDIEGSLKRLQLLRRINRDSNAVVTDMVQSRRHPETGWITTAHSMSHIANRRDLSSGQIRQTLLTLIHANPHIGAHLHEIPVSHRQCVLDALSTSTTLQTLDLQAPGLRSFNLQRIVDVLERVSSHTPPPEVHLDLSHNNIDDAGALALAHCAGIKALNVSHNEIGNLGLQALSASQIEKVDTSFNENRRALLGDWNESEFFGLMLLLFGE